MTSLTPSPYFNDYFARMVDALEILRLPARAQCEAMGAYNSGWELQHDVMDMIDSVTASPSNTLTVGQSEALRRLRALASELPSDAIHAPGKVMTTFDGCMAALSHPAWHELRVRAARELDLLQVEIVLNRARLASQ